MNKDAIENIIDLEIFQEEIEIYNAKLRLLNWLYEEIKIQTKLSKNLLNEIGQKLPLNV